MLEFYINIFFNQTSLHLACENNRVEIVELLKGRKDLDISIQDNNNRTGLDIAKTNDFTDIVSILSF
ncbi:hypothetical protein M9Y10_028679 [Tritrichomonas musculus]|uniref:Ankyrin repeat protein n=1 Tax=Tritrichomonas musculus TaxID=1915356 RepID=A0ABR2KNE0_9EUKA